MQTNWREEDFWEAPSSKWDAFVVGIVLGGMLASILYAVLP